MAARGRGPAPPARSGLIMELRSSPRFSKPVEQFRALGSKFLRAAGVENKLSGESSSRYWNLLTRRREEP